MHKAVLGAWLTAVRAQKGPPRGPESTLILDFNGGNSLCPSWQPADRAVHMGVLISDTFILLEISGK